MLVAAVVDAQYFGYGDGYYSPVEDYDWPMSDVAYPIYDDLPTQYYRIPRSKKGKKGGDDGWGEIFILNLYEFISKCLVDICRLARADREERWLGMEQRAAHNSARPLFP